MAEQHARDDAPEKRDESIKETLISIIISFALAFVARSYVAEPFVIPTGSMAPTLNGAHMRFHSPASGYQWAANPSDYDRRRQEPLPIQGSRAINFDPVQVADPMTGRQWAEADVPTRAGDRILVLVPQVRIGGDFGFHQLVEGRGELLRPVGHAVDRVAGQRVADREVVLQRHVQLGRHVVGQRLDARGAGHVSGHLLLGGEVARDHLPQRLAHLRFGIDQELPRGHDHLAGLEAGDDLDHTLAGLDPQSHVARLELALAPADERDLPFWDALDVIGINAYCPIADSHDVDARAMREAWRPHLDAFERLATEYNKPIVFTEIGYASIDGAAKEPFRWPNADDREDRAEQAACYRAFFDAVRDRPWFAGFFLWKYKITVETRDPSERHFVFQGKPAETTIKQALARPFAFEG